MKYAKINLNKKETYMKYDDFIVGETFKTKVLIQKKKLSNLQQLLILNICI